MGPPPNILKLIPVWESGREIFFPKISFTFELITCLGASLISFIGAIALDYLNNSNVVDVDRVDLRDKPIITIDCDTTKDRDDAIYVEKLPNGNYKLYTSIAHISHYVKKINRRFYV